MLGQSLDWSGQGEKMIKVYIASPYTIGDTAINVKLQMDTASILIDKGFCPFWPLHSHFLHMIHPKEYEKWLEQDREWVLSCDAVLRLGSESSGADSEVELAKQNSIPVYTSLADFLAVFQARKEARK